jgi:hypothetical protein
VAARRGEARGKEKEEVKLNGKKRKDVSQHPSALALMQGHFPVYCGPASGHRQERPWN